VKDMRKEFKEIVVFIAVSGVGWLLDMGGFYILNELCRISPLLSNFVCSGAAVTFVFFVAVKAMFMENGRFVYFGFSIYLIYQVISITFFSALIDQVSHFTKFTPFYVKVGVTPITLGLNFLFSKYMLVRLIGGKSRSYSKKGL
jgi:putative flippase GtrA